MLTLGGMIGIAWFVSMFAGEQLTPPGLGTTAASCLAVALAVSIVGWGVRAQAVAQGRNRQEKITVI